MENILRFPSMVYSIVKINKNRIFIGCKSENKTFTIIDKKGNILKQRDDKKGKGVYNVLSYKNKILIATRTGKFEIVNSKTLETESIKQVSKKEDRLWSLSYDRKKDTTYQGDYRGNLYSLKNGIIDNKINLKKFHEVNEKNNNLGPSLWGIRNLGEKVFTGDRWGKVFEFDKKLNLRREIKFKESITFLEIFSKNKLLLGTRKGKLLILNLKDKSVKTIKSIKPILQKENAVWEITKSKNNFLVCFADGQLIKIKV